MLLIKYAELYILSLRNFKALSFFSTNTERNWAWYTLCKYNMWLSCVEIEYYSVAYFDHITTFNSLRAVSLNIGLRATASLCGKPNNCRAP